MRTYATLLHILFLNLSAHLETAHLRSRPCRFRQRLAPCILRLPWQMCVTETGASAVAFFGDVRPKHPPLSAQQKLSIDGMHHLSSSSIYHLSSSIYINHVSSSRSLRETMSDPFARTMVTRRRRGRCKAGLHLGAASATAPGLKDCEEAGADMGRPT